MAVAFGSSTSTAVATAATSGIINVPSGVANGDYLLLHVALAGGGSVATPTGWDLIHSQGRSAVFGRTASSEPASYTINFASTEATLIMHRYTGVDTDNPVASVRGFSNPAASASLVVPRLPIAASTGMAVSFFTHGRGSTTTTKPAAYTLAENPDSAGTGASATESGGAYGSISGAVVAAATWTTAHSVTGSQGHHLLLRAPGEDIPVGIKTWRTSFIAVSGTFTTAIPTPHRAGDLLVALISSNTSTATPPAGWETAFVHTNGAISTRCYYKIADSSAEASPSWGTMVNTVATIFVLPEQDFHGDPGTVSDATLNTTGDVPAMASFPAVSPDALIICHHGQSRGDNEANGLPTGYTEFYVQTSSNSAGGHAAQWAYGFAPTLPGATSFPLSGATTGVGVQFAEYVRGQATGPGSTGMLVVEV